MYTIHKEVKVVQVAGSFSVPAAWPLAACQVLRFLFCPMILHAVRWTSRSGLSSVQSQSVVPTDRQKHIVNQHQFAVPVSFSSGYVRTSSSVAFRFRLCVSSAASFFCSSKVQQGRRLTFTVRTVGIQN